MDYCCFLAYNILIHRLMEAVKQSNEDNFEKVKTVIYSPQYTSHWSFGAANFVVWSSDPAGHDQFRITIRIDRKRRTRPPLLPRTAIQDSVEIFTWWIEDAMKEENVVEGDEAPSLKTSSFKVEDKQLHYGWAPWIYPRVSWRKHLQLISVA